ncbi:3-dehydroquinate synthase [Macrococcus lamae]|uniref:3-dehydroquinate synthase n=1 Tax=Macrococcus lamae TaxID=198484 RepID=A0A4R6BXW2_9STAP|nr:3-dehydroquinate synthase family protein [Macrococcus lamae]TDM13217.1 3-dehydroquinate synthase [Macrococcus lamae]
MELMTTYTENNYPIIVGDEALHSLLKLTHYQHYIYIIDRRVMSEHSSKVNQLLLQPNLIFVVEAGESLKTLEQYTEIIEQILSAGITRRSVVMAVGGGSVGDFAGFIAATLLRGIDFIQIPTTILAHDSSVGGKTGLNSSAGKNLIGAFKRPAGVYYDLSFLTTLSYEEKLSGFAEVIKHAMLESVEQRQKLEQDVPSSSELNQLKNMDYWIMTGIRRKLEIVVADEFEHGVRSYLNLGHTLGHAIEFTHKIPHGHAIMIGLLYMEILSGRNPVLLLEWFKALRLPLPVFKDFHCYYDLMKKDKKNNDENIQFILLKDKPCMEHFTKEQLSEAFDSLMSLLGVDYDY